MIKTLLALVAPLTATTVLTIGASLPAQAQDSCFSNRELQAAIASGEIPPVADVLESEGVDPDDVLSVRLCEQARGLAYIVGVFDEYGEARNLVLPASD